MLLPDRLLNQRYSICLTIEFTTFMNGAIYFFKIHLSKEKTTKAPSTENKTATNAIDKPPIPIYISHPLIVLVPFTKKFVIPLLTIRSSPKDRFAFP